MRVLQYISTNYRPSWTQSKQSQSNLSFSLRTYSNVELIRSFTYETFGSIFHLSELEATFDGERISHRGAEIVDRKSTLITVLEVGEKNLYKTNI